MKELKIEIESFKNLVDLTKRFIELKLKVTIENWKEKLKIEIESYKIISSYKTFIDYELKAHTLICQFKQHLVLWTAGVECDLHFI